MKQDDPPAEKSEPESESEESEDEQPARGNMFANFGMPANETESDDTESEEEVKPEPK